MESFLKILFIHENYDNIAGQEISLLERIVGLRDLGVDCTVLLPNQGVFLDLLHKNEFKTIIFPLTRLSKRSILGYFRSVCRVQRIIKQGSFSIVHCSGAYPCQYALPATKLSGVPCVVHINSTVYTRGALWKNFVPFSNAIITVSDSVKRTVLNKISYPRRRIMTIYCAIKERDSECTYSSNELRKQLNLPLYVKIVGQVSSILPLKGLEYFIQMAYEVKKQYPAVKFLIVGRSYDEDYNKKLQEQIIRLNLKDEIIFTGFQEHVYQYFELLDVMVLASLSEGLGRVIVEAQILGKPVVATNVGGCPEALIDKQTGILVPPYNVDELSKAVLQFLRNPVKAKEFGEKGRLRALRMFSVVSHAQKVKTLYEHLQNNSFRKISTQFL